MMDEDIPLGVLQADALTTSASCDAFAWKCEMGHVHQLLLALHTRGILSDLLAVDVSDKENSINLVPSLLKDSVCGTIMQDLKGALAGRLATRNAIDKCTFNCYRPSYGHPQACLCVASSVGHMTILRRGGRFSRRMRLFVSKGATPGRSMTCTTIVRTLSKCPSPPWMRLVKASRPPMVTPQRRTRYQRPQRLSPTLNRQWPGLLRWTLPAYTSKDASRHDGHVRRR